MSPLGHPLVDIFLLGYIAACSLVAGLFFLRFWRGTRDFLFLSFAIFFVIWFGSDSFIASLDHPNWGTLWLLALRPLSSLLVLAAIFMKNTARE